MYSTYFICHIYMIGYPYSNETDWHQSLLIAFKASLKKTVCFSSLGPSSHHGDKHATWWQISPWSVKRWRKISRIASRENVLRICHFRYNQSYDVVGWDWDHEFLQKRGGVSRGFLGYWWVYLFRLAHCTKSWMNFFPWEIDRQDMSKLDPF